MKQFTIYDFTGYGQREIKNITASNGKQALITFQKQNAFNLPAKFFKIEKCSNKKDWRMYNGYGQDYIAIETK